MTDTNRKRIAKAASLLLAGLLWLGTTGAARAQEPVPPPPPAGEVPPPPPPAGEVPPPPPPETPPEAQPQPPAPPSEPAQEPEPQPQPQPEPEPEPEPEAPLVRDVPPFRTDLGIHLSFGGSSCLGGGTEYAECSDADNTWDTSIGLAGGLLVRPIPWISAGIDVAWMRMKFHQETANSWTDLQVGPVLRGHLPLWVRDKVYLEPNLGLHAGWVRGNFAEAIRENGDEVDYDHSHLGGFLAILLGIDWFVLPKLGLGLEFRLLRTFYDEVCFETVDGKYCRGVDDKAVTERWDLGTGYPGEKGLAEYPWKLFWGVHAIYYI